MNNKKVSFSIYVALRALVVVCIILQIIGGKFDNVFLCIFYLALLMLPMLVQDKFKIELPSLLEIIIYLFIFSGTVLGEIHNFYGNIHHWDTMLHFINGFICAGIGFSLVDIFHKNVKKINLSPLYMAFVAICFSMMVGASWELFEYSADKLLLTDMQKDTIVKTISTVELDPLKNNHSVVIKGIEKTVLYDKSGNEVAIIEGGYLDIGLNDTMKDLAFDFMGAVLFSIFGYFYMRNKNKCKFIKNFIPERVERKG